MTGSNWLTLTPLIVTMLSGQGLLALMFDRRARKLQAGVLRSTSENQEAETDSTIVNTVFAMMDRLQKDLERERQLRNVLWQHVKDLRSDMIGAGIAPTPMPIELKELG